MPEGPRKSDTDQTPPHPPSDRHRPASVDQSGCVCVYERKIPQRDASAESWGRRLKLKGKLDEKKRKGFC